MRDFAQPHSEMQVDEYRFKELQGHEGMKEKEEIT
jgi:hypothetical protein